MRLDVVLRLLRQQRLAAKSAQACSPANGNSAPAFAGRPPSQGLRVGALMALAALVLPFGPAPKAQTPASSQSLSLPSPPGWMLQAPDGERIMFLGPDGLSLISVSVQIGTLERIFEQLTQPILLGEAILIPLAAPSREGARVGNGFLVSGLGPLSRAMIMAQSAPSGRLLVVFGLTQPGKEAQLTRAITGVFETASLPAAPSPSPAGAKKASGEDPLERWRRRVQEAMEEGRQ